MKGSESFRSYKQEVQKLISTYKYRNLWNIFDDCLLFSIVGHISSLIIVYLKIKIDSVLLFHRYPFFYICNSIRYHGSSNPPTPYNSFQTDNIILDKEDKFLRGI